MHQQYKGYLPVCSQIYFLPFLSSALYCKWLALVNYTFQTPFQTGFWLDLANGRHWQEFGGWEKRKIMVYPHFSLSFRGHFCSDCVSPWLKNLLFSPFLCRPAPAWKPPLLGTINTTSPLISPSLSLAAPFCRLLTSGLPHFPPLALPALLTLL